MQIGAMDFHIYNTNRIDAASMNRVRAIPSDVNAEKTDYSGLVGNRENTNQLRPGETADFAAIIEQQMSMSQQNATRVMREEEPVEDVSIESRAADAAALRDEAAETAARETAANPREDIAQDPAGVAASANNFAAEMADEVSTAFARVEVEENERPYETARAEEEQMAAPTANDQNVPGTVTAVISEEGAVSAFAREQTVGNPVENFSLGANPSGVESIGATVFANVIPDGLAGPYTNAAVEVAEENAETARETMTVQNEAARTQVENEESSNIFQMRRATDAYAMAMGL